VTASFNLLYLARGYAVVFDDYREGFGSDQTGHLFAPDCRAAQILRDSGRLNARGFGYVLVCHALGGQVGQMKGLKTESLTI